MLSFSCVFAAEASKQKIFQYQQRLIENPRDTDALLNLALEYSLANDYVKAVETYFALLRIDPNNFHAYNNLGILYRKGGQFKDSVHCYEKAAGINPDSYWVPYNLGLCYESMGRMQEARESYGRALSLNPSFTQALQRLRSLSGSDEALVPQLPSLDDSTIYLADSQSSQPRVVSPRAEQAAPIVSQKPKQTAQSKAEKAPKTEKSQKISDRVAARLKEQKEKNKKYRTARKGPAAAIFNLAMDSLDQGKLEKAIELYAACILSERDFLAEPENGLIKKGLEFLKERPNRMPNGQFFRGLLIYISGRPALAVPDMTAFLETNKNNANINKMYIEEANRVIERCRLEQEAMAAAKEAEKEAKEAMQRQIAAKLAEANPEKATDTAEIERASDFLVKRMTVEQIVEEADRLARSSHLQDAAAVLETGLRHNEDCLPLLMKSANVYTDMMLLKGDMEAGKMALMRFEKIRRLAKTNSREWAIAGEMISELNGRVR